MKHYAAVIIAVLFTVFTQSNWSFISLNCYNTFFNVALGALLCVVVGIVTFLLQPEKKVSQPQILIEPFKPSDVDLESDPEAKD